MKCGPFELVRPIASGGMGSVWEATTGDATVAVKFVTTPDRLMRERFATEVRAHASLSHPHILQVLDLGVLHEDIPNGPRAGADWMAMELVRGGDARSLIRDAGWPETATFLMAVLDGLAEAHSRGVVHLDLKPANVLLAGTDDLRPGVKLADFGIARVLGEVEESDAIMGTAAIMAPEQWLGDSRAIGPWTDLYALGCVAFRMVSGRWPFRTKPMSIALYDHTERLVPTPIPRFEVPSGLGRWVKTLLAKEPRARFGNATEATDALWRVCGVLPPVAHRALAASRSALTLTREADRSSWRRPAAPPHPAPLLEAGIGLLPLRALPPVGHDDARDALWRALETVLQDRTPRCVVLEGPPGAGLSHLGDWFSQVGARERGVLAAPIRHYPDDGPDEALLRALRALLSLQDVGAEGLAETVSRQLALHGLDDARLRDVLVGLLDGSNGSHGARRGALRRLLVSLGTRGAICWIDDADRCPDAVRFAVNTVRNLEDSPILFVLASHEAVELDVPAERIAVGPMSGLQCAALAQSTLPLELGAQHRIIDQSASYGGRIVRRIQRMAHRAGFVRGAAGFAIAPGASEPSAGAELSIPVDGDDARDALCVAAAMGGEVKLDIWSTAFQGEHASWAIPVVRILAGERVLEALLRSGTARTTPDGLRWVEPEARDAVRRAFPAGMEAAHRALATVYEERTPNHVQVGRHWRDGGELDRAVVAYERASGSEIGLAERGARDYIVAMELLEVYDRLGVSPSDRRRVPPYISRCIAAGVTTEGRSEMAALLARAQTHGWTDLEACCLAQQAKTAHGEEREDLTAQAEALFRSLEDGYAKSRAGMLLGGALYQQGRIRDSLRIERLNLEMATRQGFWMLAESSEVNILNALQTLGELTDRDLCERKAAELEAKGYQRLPMTLWVCAGELAYREGDLDASDTANRRAAALSGQLMNYRQDALVPWLNITVNAFARREPTQMRASLDSAWRIRPDDRMDGPLLALELVWATLAGDPVQTERRLAQLVELIATTPLDRQAADLLREAADEVADADLRARIRRLTGS